MARRRPSQTRKPAERPACKDCGSTTRRLQQTGARTWRCVTCVRERRAATRRTAHGRYVEATYGITENEYWALYEAQGGRCYICQRATGRSKRLAVDHDHSCCPETPACGRCVRGLLCKLCNRDVLGHLRDSIEALQRGIDYLTNPPARRVLTRFQH